MNGLKMIINITGVHMCVGVGVQVCWGLWVYGYVCVFVYVCVCRCRYMSVKVCGWLWVCVGGYASVVVMCIFIQSCFESVCLLANLSYNE